jgi:hypothetical protein
MSGARIIVLLFSEDVNSDWYINTHSAIIFSTCVIAREHVPFFEKDNSTPETANCFKHFSNNEELKHSINCNAFN